jgi:hypothetical protein
MTDLDRAPEMVKRLRRLACDDEADYVQSAVREIRTLRDRLEARERVGEQDGDR